MKILSLFLAFFLLVQCAQETKNAQTPNQNIESKTSKKITPGESDSLYVLSIIEEAKSMLSYVKDEKLNKFFDAKLKTAVVRPGFAKPDQSIKLQIVFVTDKEMDKFAKETSMFMYPSPSGPIYVFVKKSEFATLSLQQLAIRLLHEFFHIDQYENKHSKFFVNVNEETILARESEAWLFEADLYFLLHPDEAHYLREVTCEGDIYQNMSIFKKDKQISEDLLEYLYSVQCTEKFLRSRLLQQGMIKN